MIIDPIPLSGPSIGHREIELAAEAGGVGWNTRASQHVRIFERLMADLAHQSHALALNSAHAATRLAFACLGLQPDDEVLLPEIADPFLASAVVHSGMTPVFCDVDPVTLTMAPSAVESRIGPRSRCMIPTHLYGQPCDMNPLIQLAHEHGIFVIENATQGMCGLYHGRPVGSMGNFSIFAFEPDAPVTAGGGAVLLTSDDRLAATARKLAGNGSSAANPMVIDAAGHNCHLSNLQAAVGIAQLERIKEIFKQKRTIFNWYKEELKYTDGIRLNATVTHTLSSRWMTVLFLENPELDRPDIMKRLLASKVHCAPVFYPLSHMPLFQQQDNPVAYSVGTRAIVLPSGHNRNKDEIAYVGSVLRQILADPDLPAATVMPRGSLKYKSDTLELLASIKREGPRIPFVHAGKEYALRVVTPKVAVDKAFIDEILALRTAHPEAYLTNVPISREELTAIMHGYERSRDFLLFVIADEHRNWGSFALVGFDFKTRECKTEALLMHDDAPKGLAAAASIKRDEWCGETFGLEGVYNHILGSNRKSRLLSSAIGYSFLNDVCLYKADIPGGWTYRPMHIAGKGKAEDILIVSGKRFGGEKKETGHE
ncbi:MAG: DegT/DnrJ/EryC1/StrS aminotransferase family protein [Desulfovibrio sp.]|jgi:perosamine synthetase|nr:DegT/DnrJ/EryC1/StrS aminotransferase family protein [Desulfovibrio sp.]